MCVCVYIYTRSQELVRGESSWALKVYIYIYIYIYILLEQLEMNCASGTNFLDAHAPVNDKMKTHHHFTAFWVNVLMIALENGLSPLSKTSDFS